MNEYRERIHQAIGKAEEPLRLLQSGKLDRKTALTFLHKLDWKKAAVISLGTAAVASAVSLAAHSIAQHRSARAVRKHGAPHAVLVFFSEKSYVGFAENFHVSPPVFC